MFRVLNLTGQLIEAGKDEVIHTEPDGERYDRIITARLFSRTDPADIPDRAQELVSWLAPGGELHLYEPSAEFAAREILARRIVPPLYLHLFGSREAPHRAIFTLEMLRSMLRDMGLMTARAETLPYTVARDAAGRTYQADWHWVVGLQGREFEKRWIG